MNWMALLLIIEILVTTIVFFRVKQRYDAYVKEYKGIFRFYSMAPLTLYIIDRSKLLEKHPYILTTIHYRMIALHGHLLAVPYSRMFLAQIGSISLLLFMFCTMLGALSESDGWFLIYGVVLVIFVPAVMIRDLNQQIQRKKQQMLLLLPELLNKLILLVNAGENVHTAIIRCADDNNHSELAKNHPLLIELHTLSVHLKNNYSFTLAMEEFSKRCSLMEVNIFTSTVLLNYRRGGEDFVLALRNLSRELWEKRKAVSRIMGEEASSKLVFPMVLIFLIVMIVVAAPAILMMNDI